MFEKIPHERRGSGSFREKVLGGIFNTLDVSREPAFYVAPRSEEEVAQVIDKAREARLKIAIRSGGRSWLASSIPNDGVVLDLGCFDKIEIDVANKLARVGPAVRAAPLAAALAREGLAFPVGHCGSPGLGGYLLGGGLGLNWGQWKPACYSLRAIRVVTPSGERLHCSSAEHGEWLWMARGGGASFPGVVTECEIELKPRPEATTISQYAFRFEDAEVVADWVCAASSKFPANVELALVTAGPGRPFMTPDEGFPEAIVCVLAMAFVDSADEAARALAPLASPPIEPLVRVELAPTPFESIHQFIDVDFPENHRYLADTFWSDRNTRAVVESLSQTIEDAPSGKSFVMVIMPGNGAPRTGLSFSEGAYSMDARTLVLSYAVWEDAADDSENRAWMKALGSQMEALSVGHFVSEADFMANRSRAERSFTPENWARLQQLRAQVDPDRLFASPF